MPPTGCIGSIVWDGNNLSFGGRGRILNSMYSINIQFIVPVALIFLFSQRAGAQLKVANYCYGRSGTEAYEHFEFWVRDGKWTDVRYRYGKGSKEARVYYIGKDVINEDTCFRIQFTNNYTLYIVPDRPYLKIMDKTGKYSKRFSWEYEGPITGIGTYCEPCFEEEDSAFRSVVSAYLK